MNEGWKRDNEEKLKNKLRKEIKEKLKKQNVAQRLRKSQLIKEKLFALSEFKQAKWVMFYLAKEEEVQTRTMIAQAQRLGKRILLPAILKQGKGMIAAEVKDLRRELGPGPYGILQPKNKYIREIPPKLIELVVVPGLAFDRQGRRLGRGKGYYDRFLSKVSRHTPRIGLAFDFQLLPRLPALAHDVAVSRVIAA